MNTGRWTENEQRLYDKYIYLLGGDYKLLSRYITTRNITQIRSHHQKEFFKKKQYALILLEISKNI